MRFQLAPGDDAHTTLATYIRDVQTTRRFGMASFSYLRAAEIRDLASDHNIAFVVNNDTRLAEGYRDSMISQIQSAARKVFLISVHAGMSMRELHTMLELDLKDQDLPLNNADINTHRRSHQFDRFQSCQQIIPPVLTESAFLTYIVGQDIPIQREDKPIIPGTDSRIYRASMDTDYYAIASLKSLPDDPSLSQMLAIQEINTASLQQQAHARDRIQVAKFIATHVRHEHVVKPFGSFALRSTYPGETTQHILTELHDTDLSVMSKRHKPPSAAASWVRRQILGLAEALAVMHTPRDGNFAVHHDIKSQTIAVFLQQERTCKLPLSSRGRILASDDSEHISVAPIASPYSPPESTGGYLTGRPHDIWSLGCVFLELMVWCTQGQKPYVDFVVEAAGKDVSRYWFLDIHGETVLQNTVKQQLDILGRRELGKWANSVTVIRRMLAIDASSRVTASELVAELNDPGRPF